MEDKERLQFIKRVVRICQEDLDKVEADESTDDINTIRSAVQTTTLRTIELLLEDL